MRLLTINHIKMEKFMLDLLGFLKELFYKSCQNMSCVVFIKIIYIIHLEFFKFYNGDYIGFHETKGNVL